MTTNHPSRHTLAPLLFAALALFWLIGCASNTQHQTPTAGGLGFAAIGALPVDTRAASALALIDGVSTDVVGAGTTPEGDALRINSAGFDFSFGRYVFGLPLDATLLGLDINVEEVASEYWVGVSGYGTTGGWEWEGPFTDDTRIDFGAQFADYLSPNDNLYWVVLAADENSLLLVDTTVDWEPFQIEFRVPPPGQQFAAPAPALAPSMVLMPQIEDWSDEGAPVIFYTADVDSSPRIFFAYYNGTIWKQRELNAGGPAMSHPVATWTESGGTLFAFDPYAGVSGNGKLVKIDTDETWTVTSTEEVGGVEDRSLSHLKVDYEPVSGNFLVLHAYTGDPLHEVFLTYGQTGSWHTTQHDSFTGDTIAGADVSFDPAGGEPWAVFSSGTIDDSETIILDFRLNMGRYDGATWNWSILDHDEPLTVDLGFKDDNSPQLVMVSVRLWVFSWPFPPINIEASILADISVGEFNGSSWDFTTLHTSEVDISEFLSNQIGLNLGIDCTWATSGSLSFANADGFVTFAASPFAITDGTLVNHTSYFVDGAGGYERSSWFTGDPGVAFSWQLGTPGLMCAYLFADELDVAQGLGGSSDIANDLIFWRPGG